LSFYNLKLKSKAMPENKKRILLVEDDRFLSDMYSTKLAESGFEVELAVDGEEGLAKIKEKKPDLVLLDIVLPKKDGFEIMQEVRKDESLKNVLIIALTNLGQKEEVEKGMKLGANDYIIKAHFTPTEVDAKIRALFAKQSQ